MYAYGDTVEAERIWSEMSGQAQVQYRDESFLREVSRASMRLCITRCFTQLTSASCLASR